MTDARRRWIRLALVAILAVGLLVLARRYDLGAYFQVERLRASVERAGAWGVAVYLLAAIVGTLVHVPGLVFVGVAVALWGYAKGVLLAFVGAILAVTVSFVVVRAVGGKPLEGAERPLLKRLMAPLERRPVRTVIALRTVLIISPPLNYALALSPIRLRDFLVGSAIGLVAPLLVTAYFIDSLL